MPDKGAPRVTGDVALRDVVSSDIPRFFEHQLDLDANRMAAFTSKDPTDRGAFQARFGCWRRTASRYAGRTRGSLTHGANKSRNRSLDWTVKIDSGIAHALERLDLPLFSQYNTSPATMP